MSGEIMISVLIGIGAFFLNPVLYVGLFLMAAIGYIRVKREREHFKTRVFGIRAELVVPFLPSLVSGVVVSVVFIGMGLTVNLELIALFAVVSLLLIASTVVRWITPAYVGAFTLIALIAAPFIETGVSFIDQGLQSASEIPLMYLLFLTVILLLTEGLLILTKGGEYTSPKLEKSKRGKWIGLHEAKRMWLLPVVVFIPEGAIPSFEFWPVFSFGEGTYQPLLVPFLIGFHQRVHSALPALVTKKVGMQIVWLALVLALLTYASYFSELAIYGFIAVALIGRELIYWIDKKKEKGRPFFFSQLGTGCIILGVLPNSPAEKMKLSIGEMIVKVNGIPVHNEVGFYEALQHNSAFCKLEVKDINGEIRFAQGALYDGEHHQLGVLLVKEEYELQDSVI